MTLSQEEKQDILRESRLLIQAYPILGPMLERRKKATYQRMISSYRAGELNKDAVAELSVIEGIQDEIRTKIEYADAMGEKK